MKILWITPWFLDYRIPVYKLLNELSGNNFYLMYSTSEVPERVHEKLQKELGDNAIALKAGNPLALKKSDTTFSNTELIIRRQPDLYKKIKSVKPDVIITEGFGGWAPKGIKYAFFNRKKLLMFYERTAYIERNAPWWRTLYRKIAGRPVDHFLINGSLTRQYLEDVLKFKKTPKTEGVMCADSFGLSTAVKNVQKQELDNLKKELNLKNGLTFLFVGQIVKRKGIEELLTAWTTHLKTHPNDNLIALGKGVLLDELKEKYKDEQSIHLLGAIDYDSIFKYYASADVFIMPTLEDNWCLVVPEAMTCGLPIACSIYNGGHKELVLDGKNGYNFDPHSQESIIETLSKFHTSDLSAMGKESIRIESAYTPDIAAQKIYDACVSTFKTKRK